MTENTSTETNDKASDNTLAPGPGKELSKNAGEVAGKGKTPSTRRQGRWSTRQLALMGVFTAIGAAFTFIPIPLWPPASVFNITYDPANVPAAIGVMSMGIGPGALIGILTMLIHWMLTGDTIGILINIISVTAFVVPLGLICRRRKTTTRLIIGLLAGSCLSALIMVPTNLVIWPSFYHMPFEVTLTYVWPLIIPFNILKAVLNSILVFGLYQSLHKLIER